MGHNNITNNEFFKRKNTKKIAEDPNYEYWRNIEKSERLSKQFAKQNNMCCFTMILSLTGCICLPCIVYNKIHPEEKNEI
jgi:hypothetical protein